MQVLRMLTAGESHGPSLVGIMEGFPAQVPLDVEAINYDLRRRQGGFGRGGRMGIERDQIEFLGGLRGSVTLGSPLAFLIHNKDYENWQASMDPVHPPLPGGEVTKPRPGHADLSGALKYGFRDDLRPVLERSSARETAARVAMGSICAQFLSHFGITARSHVVAIGGVTLAHRDYSFKTLEAADQSDVRCIDEGTATSMRATIGEAQSMGDSLGGLIEVIIRGVPVGLGSYVQWDRKLDARLAMALMSIQGMKAVEIGAGLASANAKGSQFHDPILYSRERGFWRATNHAGGIEGGMSTGENLVVRVAMKPIPTLRQPLPTVDLGTLEPTTAMVERSDVCAVPAASVVAELVAVTVVADAFLEVYGSDHLEGIMARWNS